MVLLNKVEQTLDEGLVGVTEEGERVLLTEPVLISNVIYVSTLTKHSKDEHTKAAKHLAQQELRGLEDYCQMGQSVMQYPTEDTIPIPVSAFTAYVKYARRI